MRPAVLLLAALVIAPGVAAAERRPTAISMGVSGTVESAPFAHSIIGLPVSINAGTVVDGELWWHAGASFGSADAPDAGDGHTFELSTGPRVQHCWDRRICVGASLELGWGHSRWNVPWRAGGLTFDDVHVEGRVRAAAALSASGLVLIEASAGPRARYYLRGSDDDGPLDDLEQPFTRGFAGGLALIVRN